MRVKNILFGGLTAVLVAALTIVPVMLVGKGGTYLFRHWQETGFYLVSIICSGITGMLGCSLARGEKELVRQRMVVWGGCIFFFLYVACAALCERLSIGAISAEPWRTVGFTLICLGATLRIWSVACLGRLHSALVALQSGHTLVTSGPYRLLRHPSYLSVLLFLTGLPLVFGTWFPLLAMPGACVALKWRITDEEAFLVSQFGEQYESYQKTTWRLIPYLYSLMLVLLVLSKLLAVAPTSAAASLATGFKSILAVSPTKLQTTQADCPTPEPSKASQPDPVVINRALETYVERLKSKIMQSWHPPGQRKVANTTVSFSVSRIGTIGDIQVTASSGDSQVDDTAVKTLESLSPVEPLPQGSPEKLVVDFAFSYFAIEKALGEPETQLAMKEQLAQENPADPKAAYEYGRALRFAGHFQEAIDQLKRSIELGYVGAAPRIELAASYNKLGKPQEAENTLREVIKANPGLSAPVRLLADICYEQKRWSEAKSNYQEFLRFEPTGPVAELASMRIQLCQKHIEGLSEPED
ncbi:MAG: TonB family protein [Candidatus Melainabacteria bacterium]|nr:TonB family protein [Candidatus Melainabacteria bacterium]